MAIVPHNTMEVILNVKAGLHLHKDCAVVTLTNTVMDRCICSQQVGKDEVKYVVSFCWFLHHLLQTQSSSYIL